MFVTIMNTKYCCKMLIFAYMETNKEVIKGILNSINEYRKFKKVSKVKLAVQIGRSTNHVSNVFSGKSSCTLRDAEAMCKVLGLKLTLSINTDSLP